MAVRMGGLMAVLMAALMVVPTVARMVGLKGMYLAGCWVDK